MTKKLKILGPYTPEHPGPFCTRDGRSVRIICTDRKGKPPIIGLVQDGGREIIISVDPDGVAVPMAKYYDLMNAEEVPVAREFWVNEYDGDKATRLHLTEASAKDWGLGPNYIRTIHVREVLPGDGE